MEKPETYLDGNANELTECIDRKVIHSAAQRLLTIFPEEIWVEILGKIRTASDLESLSNASLFFRQLLAPKANLFLFPNVFKILASRRIHNSDNFWQVTGKCRLVCRSWNQNIQHFYESHNALNFAHVKNLNIVVFPTSNSSGINEFIEHFDKTHYSTPPPWKNPFLGRAVIFNDTKFHPGVNTDGLNYLSWFWTDISNLLVKYGSHIWYCTIHLEDKFSSRQEYYFKLSEWVDLMTNLRSLQVIYYHNNKHKINSIARLERDIMEHPFPKLRHLESLTMTHVPEPISDEISRRNCHVTGLVVNGKTRKKVNE